MSNQVESNSNERELFNEPTLIDLEGMEEEGQDNQGLLDNDVNNWRQGNPSRVTSRSSDQSASKFSYLAVITVGLISFIAVLVFSYRLFSPVEELQPIRYFGLIKQTWVPTFCKSTTCLPDLQL